MSNGCSDATGEPIRAWNSRGYAFRTEYDELRRPLKSFVRGGYPLEAAETLPREILFDRTIYGDSPETGMSEGERQQANLRGEVFQHFDGAGIVVTDLYDFKGNPLRNARRFAREYKNAPDWSQAPALEEQLFTGTSVYDALNRMIAATAPDNSIYRPTFNEANLLEAVHVNLRGAQQDGQPIWTPFITYINYDAKGQRSIVRYANTSVTTYEYDRQTFRLLHLKTTRVAVENGVSAKIFNDLTTLQDLRYTYDPIGNITRIEDAALKTVFHANQQIGSSLQLHIRPALSSDRSQRTRAYRTIGVQSFPGAWRLPRLSLCRRRANH